MQERVFGKMSMNNDALLWGFGIYSVIFLILLGLTGFGMLKFDLVDQKVYSPEELGLRFTTPVKQELFRLWDETGDSEYAACIQGSSTLIDREDGSGYANMTFTLREISEYKLGKTNYVEGMECLGFAHLHKHPDIGCSERMWKGDVLSAKNKFEKGFSLYIIQCERDTFEIYDRDDLYNSKLVMIKWK